MITEREREVGRKWRERHRAQERERYRCYYKANRDRILEKQRLDRESNPEKYQDRTRRSWLKVEYDLTLEDYESLLKKQNGRCKICGALPEERFRVDHDHKTGEIRGLLCHSCNVILGHSHDSVDILQNAISYLKGDA